MEKRRRTVGYFISDLTQVRTIILRAILRLTRYVCGMAQNGGDNVSGNVDVASMINILKATQLRLGAAAWI